MSAVQLEAVAGQPVGLLLGRHTRAVLPIVRHVVEHVPNARPLSRVRSPVEVDVVSQLRRMVAARRLVRAAGFLNARRAEENHL